MFRLISATDEGEKDQQQQNRTQCETTYAAVEEAYKLSVGSIDASQEMKKTPEKLNSSTPLHGVETASLHESSTREPHDQKRKEDIETPSEDLCVSFTR